MTAAVALTFGHWPFATPLLEMDPLSEDWDVACSVIDLASKYRLPEEA